MQDKRSQEITGKDKRLSYQTVLKCSFLTQKMSFLFKIFLLEKKGNTRAEKWNLRFIWALSAAVINAGFWKRLVPLLAKDTGVQPG